MTTSILLLAHFSGIDLVVQAFVLLEIVQETLAAVVAAFSALV